MNKEAIERCVREELGRIAPEIDLHTIDKNEDLREEFDIDSMDYLNLVSALSRRLETPIPESDYARMGSFAAIVNYLNSACS